MKMQKQFRIGHVADLLGVKRFVIRFWEKEFNLQAYRSDGGQRFYQQKDIDQFKLIHQLLYEKKFTIAGAKKILSEKEYTLTPQQKKSTIQKIDHAAQESSDFSEQLLQLRQKLVKLQQLL